MSKQSKVPVKEMRRKPGPAPKPMPDEIDASPRELARAIMQKPPKKTWRFLDKKKTG